MKHIGLFVLVQLCFLIVLDAQTASVELQSELDKLIEAGNIGVSAACYVDGELTLNHSAGYANVDDKISFTNQTLTRIASIVKPMTSVAILQLAEVNKLSLDDEIQKYIPDFPVKSKNPITIRHLLSHTSGVSAYKNGKEANSMIEYATLNDALNIFKDRKLKFEPGTEYAYTTYGYVVLGVIIEAVSGQSYEEYMQEGIWDIANMRHTGVEKFSTKYDNKSKLYHREKDQTTLQDQTNLSSKVPGGGVYSTVEDLLNFGNALLNLELINQKSLDEMLTVPFTCEQCERYALGLNLQGPKGNERGVIGHSGGQIGSNTQIMMIPKYKAVVAVLSNTSGTGNGITMLALELIEDIIDANRKE